MKAWFVLMVMDRAGWHLAGQLVATQNMRLVFLPPCSPELDLAEHLCNALREDCFANHVFRDPEAVEAVLWWPWRTIQSGPDQ